MEDALNAPYRPCKLLNKILPATFIDFLFNPKRNNRNDRESSETRNIDKKGDLFALRYDDEESSLSTKLVQTLNNNKPSKHVKRDDKGYDRNKGYVFHVYFTYYCDYLYN